MAFWGVRGKCYCFVLCMLATLRETAGFQLANFRVAGFRQARNAGLIHAAEQDTGDEEGSDLMSELMMEVNQRESLLRREGVRRLERPSALLPPHTVLEHVLSSLQNADFPHEGAGWQKAWLFSALDHEVSRGPVDFRRDWTDADEMQPRYLALESFVAVMGQALPFLAFMQSFNMAGEPVFDDDDHRVTFPIRVVAEETETAVNWAEMDFRLSKVRDGSYKDCWLMERAIIRDSGYDAK